MFKPSESDVKLNYYCTQLAKMRQNTTSQFLNTMCSMYSKILSKFFPIGLRPSS